MKILILRSFRFDDEKEPELVKQLIAEYESSGHTVAIYNMPACDDLSHWAAFAIIDYTKYSDIMVCIDFPTSLIKHNHKRVILTKPLTDKPQLQSALKVALSECVNCCQTGEVLSDIPLFLGAKEFVSEEMP